MKADSWKRDGMPTCQRCLTVFELVDFPRLYQNPASQQAHASEALSEEATCYFHPKSQAEHVCESCGRYLCPVCAIDFGGSRLCPSCIERKQKEPASAEPGRMMWDGVALSLALVPLIIWPITVVTGPASLGAAIVGWKKPQSLVRSNRGKLVLAMVIASLQIAGWLFLFGSLIWKNYLK